MSKRPKLVLFLKDENAQAMTEYALLALVFALASYGAIKLFLAGWKAMFNRVTATRTEEMGMGP